LRFLKSYFLRGHNEYCSHTCAPNFFSNIYLHKSFFLFKFPLNVPLSKKYCFRFTLTVLIYNYTYWSSEKLFY